MTDLNNSGMSDLEDVNEVLKDSTKTTSEKVTELGKIKQKFGKGGFVKIDKYIEIDDGNGNKTYYGICKNKLKQSRYTNFKKKNENTSAEFDNAFIDRVLDYDDLTQTTANNNEGALDSKEKLQKMVDLTNSKTTTTADEKKFAGKDKDIHITVDGEGSGTTGKSYKIGNFSGWRKSGSKVSYDTDKVGAGNRPSGGTAYDTQWKKEKTMYWKKNTAASGATSNAGVYKKKKKKGTEFTGWGQNGFPQNKKTVDNINKTELDDVKNTVDTDSPIIEVGETDNTTDGDAYVLFKLKKKPKNATKVE